jgi:anti-sigma factor RsiW
MTCRDLAHELDAYVDSELDEQLDTAFSEHASVCNGCQQQIADREWLRRTIRRAPRFPAPDRLHQRLHAQTAARRWWYAAAAGASAAVLALGMTWTALAWRPVDARQQIVSAAVDAHLRSLVNAHLVDVPSTDQHTVKPWFAGRLPFSPPVADLQDAGFVLAGGRLDYIEGAPAAALIYQRRQHVINVFVRPSSSALPAWSEGPVRGYSVRHFDREDMSFLVVSDLNTADLSTFVAALQTRLADAHTVESSR